MQRGRVVWSRFCVVGEELKRRRGNLQVLEVGEHILKVEEFVVAEGVDGRSVTAVQLVEAFALEEESPLLVGRSALAPEVGDENANEVVSERVEIQSDGGDATESEEACGEVNPEVWRKRFARLM